TVAIAPLNDNALTGGKVAAERVVAVSYQKASRPRRRRPDGQRRVHQHDRLARQHPAIEVETTVGDRKAPADGDRTSVDVESGAVGSHSAAELQRTGVFENLLACG